MANFISNGSLNKDTAVGIAYLDRGVIVIFNPTIYNGYVNRTTNDISIENKNSGSSHEINLEIAREYHRQIKSMCIELRLPQKNF